MATAKSCLRKHWFAYEQGFRKERDTTPLRTGIAFHYALEQIGNGVDVDFAINAATADYEHFPAWCITPEDQFDWQVEGEIETASSGTRIQTRQFVQRSGLVRFGRIFVPPMGF